MNLKGCVRQPLYSRLRQALENRKLTAGPKKNYKNQDILSLGRGMNPAPSDYDTAVPHVRASRSGSPYASITITSSADVQSHLSTRHVS